MTEHPRLLTKNMIIELKKDGTLKADGPSASSIYRFVKTNRKPGELETRERRAFEAAFPNDIWQTDQMDGPRVPWRTRDGRMRKRETYLNAFIDDHSRLVPHGEFYLSGDLSGVADTLEQSTGKRGIPDRIYTDNGMVYRGTQFKLICARIGTRLGHTRKKDASAKGKIEKFWRSVRQSFLNPLLELRPPKSLEELNKAFQEWLEEYNRKPHQGIGGQTPLDRWLLGATSIRQLRDDGSMSHAFMLGLERRVRNDGTIVFGRRYFEVPYVLKGQKIEVRYRISEPERLHIYHGGGYHGVARRLDKELNSRLHRQPLRPKKEEAS
jgi:transposase InsO family protein